MEWNYGKWDAAGAIWTDRMTNGTTLAKHDEESNGRMRNAIDAAVRSLTTGRPPILD